jgi:hypothetical protein
VDSLASAAAAAGSSTLPSRTPSEKIPAIVVRAFQAPAVQQALLLSFLGLPWVYFFLKELNAFMLLRRN